MTIFLILAPFGAFALLMLVDLRRGQPVRAAARLPGRDRGSTVVRGRSVKILGAGAVVLFSAVGGYITLIDPALEHDPPCNLPSISASSWSRLRRS